MKTISKAFSWVKERIKHKIHHYSISELKKFLKKNGLAFLIIFLVWEIIEDVIFPITFIWLGKNVNPWFLTGAPISWLLCLHPIMVPFLWWVWVKISRKKVEDTNGNK